MRTKLLDGRRSLSVYIHAAGEKNLDGISLTPCGLSLISLHPKNLSWFYGSVSCPKCVELITICNDFNPYVHMPREEYERLHQRELEDRKRTGKQYHNYETLCKRFPKLLSSVWGEAYRCEMQNEMSQF